MIANLPANSTGFNYKNLRTSGSSLLKPRGKRGGGLTKHFETGEGFYSFKTYVNK